MQIVEPHRWSWGLFPMHVDKNVTAFFPSFVVTWDTTDKLSTMIWWWTRRRQARRALTWSTCPSDSRTSSVAHPRTYCILQILLILIILLLLIFSPPPCTYCIDERVIADKLKSSRKPHFDLHVSVSMDRLVIRGLLCAHDRASESLPFLIPVTHVYSMAMHMLVLVLIRAFVPSRILKSHDWQTLPWNHGHVLCTITSIKETRCWDSVHDDISGQETLAFDAWCKNTISLESNDAHRYISI